MLRALIINPILIATLGALAIGIGSASEFHFQVRDLLLAGGVSFVSAELSLIPLVIVRGKSQAVVSQAGLIGTVIHTFLCAAMGMVASAVLKTGQPLMYWLLLFYWATLVNVALASVRAVKAAPIHTNELATK